MRIDLGKYGTCARTVDVEVVDGTIATLEVHGGCPGYSRALSRIATGMSVTDFVEKVGNVMCRGHLSCAAACARELASM